MANDRIPCITPECRRTAPADKYEPGTQIVCHKCWKKLPPRLTKRHRQLAKRRRRIDRLAEKLKREGRKQKPLQLRVNRIFSLVSLYQQLTALQRRNWRDIHASLKTPDKPEGLEAFLEEMGMADD